MRLFSIAALVLLAPIVALAVTPKHDNNAPVEINADHFLADNDSRTGTWWGNVVIKQADMLMHADKVRGHVLGNTMDKIFANGHVVVDSPNSGTATGDAGVYDVINHIVTLTGHVVLKKQQNVMRGSTLAVNLTTGQAQMDARGTPTGRVQSIFASTPASK